MPLLAVSRSTRNQRTYLVALGLVIVFATAELLATLFHFSARMRSERVAVQPRATASPAAAVNPTPANPRSLSPAPSIAPDSAAVSVSDRLLKEARALNERGDTANALAQLQEASQRDPKNAPVLAEMATIYESIQSFDRSNETWQKIQELGPSAGTLYELAEMKLKTGVAAVPPPAATAKADSAGTTLDSEGIPEGSVFGVTDIASEETPDPEADTNLRLKIGIKARPGVPIDHSKLRIMVLFYDLLDNEKVVPTDADVSYEWLNPKHDWIETNPEILIVNYVRSKTHAITSDAAISAAAAAITPGKIPRSKKRAESGDLLSDADRRKYLGYIIRIFYNDKLQTIRAEPARLLTDAPNLSP